MRRFAQGAGYVGTAAHRAEAVGRGGEFGERLAGGAFFHRIDAAAGVALRFKQAGGAAHHFDTLVNGSVGELFLVVGIVAAHGADGGIDAVFADLGDVETARLVAELVALAVDVEAGGVFERVFQRGRAQIVHLLAGNHAHRLRRVFGRELKAGGGGHFGDGVGVFELFFAGNVDGLQFAVLVVDGIGGGIGCGMDGKQRQR